MGTFVLRNAIRTLGLSVCVLGIASLAEAQQSGGTGNTGGGTAASQPAAANAGQQLTSQNLFSTAGDSTGAIGANLGRFATNQFQNAPVATGTGQNTGTGGGRNTTQFRGGQNARGGNTRGGNNLNRFGQTGASRQTIRPSLRLGFAPPVRPSADVSRSVERRFSTLTARVARLGDTTPAFRGVSIQVGDAGRVTLTGEVASAQAARLAANILRMEAGVRSVQNDLTVAAK